MNQQHQQRHENTAQAHRINILKSLEHRLQVARSKGNRSLVEQLEAEKSYYNG